MNCLALLLTLFVSDIFVPAVDRAFTLAANRDWTGAAQALDQAAADDPMLFVANSLPYLRGRIAENQQDWTRSRSEFAKIGQENPLHPLAVWHTAVASAHVQDYSTVELLEKELPPDFPADLKMQLASLSPASSALLIYAAIPTRDARFETARMLQDQGSLWSLLHERKDDDLGLAAARILAGVASTPREVLEVADTLTAHRQFDDALRLYEQSAKEPALAAESRYQIARIQFLKEDYRAAIDTYTGIASDFEETDWQKDAEYQIANSYWRLDDYKASELAYLKYISKYGAAGDDGAIRNLIDVYRVLGNNGSALMWADRALARRLTLASRQAFLFTKAKLLYAQKRYAASALLFHQLAASKIRSSPGGTTQSEARYFEALALAKNGNQGGAKAIWRQLAAEPHTYYGARAAFKLGGVDAAMNSTDVCRDQNDPVLATALADLQSARRALRSSQEPRPSSAVSELIFLQLWDEASLWKDRESARVDYKTAAELAYLTGRYHRSIELASRVPAVDDLTRRLQYPAGFRQLICEEAGKYNLDPLWLHAIIWQESKYDPMARSGASARGLMQFIPETASHESAAIGLTDFSLNRLYDPAVNIPMGAHYFATLLTQLKDPVLALAAYNGGPDNARRWKNKWPDGENDFFVADIGFAETKRYVTAVYGAKAAYGSLQ